MKEIHSILIANRGEIASRIIRTCRKMGIRTVAVYSTADQKAPYVQQADTAIFIGKSQPSESYLNQDKIIAAAKKSKADAIHPGYGFLSENAQFAQKCQTENIIFIGPKAEAIEMMGSKSAAKALMEKHNVPTIPGYQGDNQSEKYLKEKALEIGLPVLLKAAAGGGGKGMRIVEKKEELAPAINAAKSEAKNSFDDDELIIEKYIAAGRHIEFQIFGDQNNNLIHILERECSIQRRYQKIMEESPSPIMTEELRAEMGAAAIKAAKALNYDNAGTVEFIYDEKSGQYYFLEINTRLQVEHLVTEAITGLDLVEMQIESAQSMPLKITQNDVVAKGYAVEVRLYAEDAANNFMPAAGLVSKFDFPTVEGLQVESAIESGLSVSVYYDPMIAKLIVWGQNRNSAHKKMHYVLSQLKCLGITTNQDFLKLLFEQDDFKKGKYNTNYLVENPQIFEGLAKKPNQINKAIIATTLYNWHQRQQNRKLLQSIPSGWRNNFYEAQKESFSYHNERLELSYKKEKSHFTIAINDASYHVKISNFENNHITLEIDEQHYQFSISQNANEIHVHNESIGNVVVTKNERLPIPEKIKEKGTYEATMPSQIISVVVKEQQKVKTGDALIVLSSMKMENTIYANEDGEVQEIYVKEGSNIEAGTMLLKIL